MLSLLELQVELMEIRNEQSGKWNVIIQSTQIITVNTFSSKMPLGERRGKSPMLNTGRYTKEVM